MSLLHHFHAAGLMCAIGCLTADVAFAQQTRNTNGRHYVYDQYVPPGVAGQMQLQAGTLRPFLPQQVRIHLPGDGQVTFFDQRLDRTIEAPAPAQAALLVGLMYRFKISGLTNFPNTEFFPSVELVDELHPPPGQAERFPIEVEFQEEELRWAASGRMVTKVVYLEQADRVPLRNLTNAPRVIDAPLGANAIGEADALGRPIAIVRLGGRLPDLHAPDPQFWGPLPPVKLTGKSAAPEGLTQRVSAAQRRMTLQPARSSSPGQSTAVIPTDDSAPFESVR